MSRSFTSRAFVYTPKHIPITHILNMEPHHETLRERTMNNENLAGPEINRAGVTGDHTSLSGRTQHNENLTAPLHPDVTSPPLEKDFSYGTNKRSRFSSFFSDDTIGPFGNGYHQHLDAGQDSETALRKIRTAGSISISPELFEKIYLSPANKVKGELRKTVGNPTPL